MAYFTGPNIVTDGLVFAVDSGSTRSYPGSGTTVDSLTGSDVGTLTNGVGFNTNSGGEFVFDGTDDYITIPGSTATNLSSTLTAEAWVYYESGNGRIFQKDGSSYTRCWEMGGYNGIFRIEMWHSNGGTTGGVSAPIALPLTTWAYLTMTFDGTNIKMYQNAVLVKTISFPGDIRTDINTPLNIGGRYATGEFFDGNIGPIRLYSQALSAAEVTQNFNAQKSRFGL